MPPQGTSLQRTMIAFAGGLVVTALLAPFTPWQFSVLTGWSGAVAVFLLRVWPAILHMSPVQVDEWSTSEDDSRAMATALLLGAALSSLPGVAFALHKASITDGAQSVGLTVVGLGTVVLSWLLVNTVYTLRYAHIFHSAPAGGVDFDDGAPDYRDFAYLAFTIGMTYQVSDTGLRTRKFRRTVLHHALLSYVFGTVIIATLINTVAGFVT